MEWDDDRDHQIALGFDADGSWELGAVPLLLAVPKLAQLVKARVAAGKRNREIIAREARAIGVSPRVLRAEIRRQRRARRKAEGGGFFRRLFKGESPTPFPPAGRTFARAPSSTTDEAPIGPRFGVTMPRGRRLRRRIARLQSRAQRRGISIPGQQGGGGGYGRRGGCVIMRGADGETLAVDEFGNVAEVVGIDDDGADFGEEYGLESYGAGDWDDDGASGDWDEDDGEDDEIMGEADDAADEAEMAADTADDQQFGASVNRLQRKISRLGRRIDRVRSKRMTPRRKGKVARLRAKRQELQRRLNRIQGKRQQAVAALTGVAAGVGAAAGLGMALASRQGQSISVTGPQSRLIDPRYAHAVRVQQHAAGLQGNYSAPPGSGRLTKLPMFDPTSAGNPRNALTVPVAGITAGTDLATEDLPYALVKLEGFVTSVSGTASDNNAIGLVEDLKIRGGTNLFLHESSAPADFYDVKHDDQITGLRDYPNIRSPNQAFVTIKASGDLDDVVVLTAAVIVDVLEDDTYGTGFPGPYAG